MTPATKTASSSSKLPTEPLKRLISPCTVAWVLAAKMDRAKELRQCLYSGLAAIGCYVAEKPKIPFDDEMFEELSQATEVARDILENSGEIERAQAAAAVMSGRIKC